MLCIMEKDDEIARIRAGVTSSPRTNRELLGRAVREEWVAWAKEQPDPKPSWLVPWEELDEPNKEVDRRIGERIARLVESRSEGGEIKCGRCYDVGSLPGPAWGISREAAGAAAVAKAEGKPELIPCPDCGWKHHTRTYRFEVGWSHDPLSKKTSHLAYHLAKIAGAFAAFEEESDHRSEIGVSHPTLSFEELDAMKAKLIRSKLPDLVMLAAMYAEAWKQDLEKLVADRSREVLKRAVEAEANKIKTGIQQDNESYPVSRVSSSRQGDETTEEFFQKEEETRNRLKLAEQYPAPGTCVESGHCRRCAGEGIVVYHKDDSGFHSCRHFGCYEGKCPDCKGGGRCQIEGDHVHIDDGKAARIRAMLDARDAGPKEGSA
jgi:hypothetical protein